MSDTEHRAGDPSSLAILDVPSAPPPPTGPPRTGPPLPGPETAPGPTARGGSRRIGLGRGPGERRQIVIVVLVMIATVCAAALAEAIVFSGLQHAAAQSRAFAQFRGDLARGLAPVGQSDQQGRLLELGTPMALLEIPAAGIHEIVGEGTTSTVLTIGPGHSRTTPFPGQAGVSVIMGRRAAFGGPFGDVPDLVAGTEITVTTGQGRSEYTVIGVRRAGDPIPAPPAAGQGRLVLVTADGPAFSPSGVVYVDADLTTPPFPSPRRIQAPPSSGEQPLGTEGTTLWPLVLWLQVLTVVVVAAIWSWSRWGRRQTWVVFVPVLVLAGIKASGAFLQLLPNLT